jgi:hypothetical protein
MKQSCDDYMNDSYKENNLGGICKRVKMNL